MISVILYLQFADEKTCCK